jgi:molecular chaperone GrpE
MSNTPDDTQDTSEEIIDPVGDALHMQTEIDALKAEKNSLYDKLARAQADFTNSRKRMENEFDQRLQYGNQKLVESMLPIVDNFERALAQDPAKVAAGDILKGMSMVFEQLRTLLQGQSVEPINPSVGDDFDPNQHQALMQQESELPEGKVTLVLQKGYAIKGRMMRPAQVAVSRGNG